MTLEGKRALVTGAGSGIGAAVARALAGQGAHVIAADVNDDAAHRIAAEVGGEPWVVDLSDTAALAEQTLDIDILVNNAGIQQVGPIETYDPMVFARIQKLMVESPFFAYPCSTAGDV